MDSVENTAAEESGPGVYENADNLFNFRAIIRDEVANSEFTDDETEQLLAHDTPQQCSYRNFMGFWLLGLCNNFSFVVMLSAAHDILSINDKNHNNLTDVASNTTRDCNEMSTGTVLLADILPCLLIKFCSSFLNVPISVSMLISVVLSMASFLLTGLSRTSWMTYSGVICASFSSGLGEVSLLRYTSHFSPKIVSAWSSGTGAAGILGSLSYASLTSFGISPGMALLIMLFCPVLESLVFWKVLVSPTSISSEQQDISFSFKDRVGLIPKLLKYMIPLSIVYFAEYLINQGLIELIYFPNIWLSHEEQYRWLQVIYQISVFISRSSVQVIKLPKLWIFALFQIVNMCIFLSEAIYLYIPYVWIIWMMSFVEGLLGGGAYVNTFYRIHHELQNDEQKYGLSIVCISDSLGITAAGLLAIPIHNVICNLPMPPGL